MRATSTAPRARGLAGLAAVTLLSLGTSATPGFARDTGAVVNAGRAGAVNGSYLVMTEEGRQSAIADRYDVRVLEKYDNAVDGMLVQASEEQAERIAADASVRLVEQNTAMRRTRGRTVTQTAPPSCGLDRIDQRALPLDGSYRYPARAGAGVDVYIVDTGIDYDHPDLAPRAGPGFDAFGGDGSDQNGNGTLMAGIVAGTQHGVAKKARLISVKVLDAQGGGTIAGVVAGVDWITEHASGPSVANFIVGVPPSEVLDQAVRNSIASGVTYSLSAGASSADVANSSPSRVTEAIVVGSSDCNDQVASFSNFGAGMDLYAPGVDITSTWPGGGTHTDWGTSVSAAHVSGAAALFLGGHPGASPRRVAEALDRASVKDALTGVPDGTPNKLLHVRNGFL